jgi:hypothetical protein
VQLLQHGNLCDQLMQQPLSEDRYGWCLQVFLHGTMKNDLLLAAGHLAAKAPHGQRLRTR